jgi:methylaspartate mutase epsilon subunit
MNDTPKLTMARWDEARFLDVRREVLAQWPTGARVDLEEGVAYQKAIPDAKRVAWKLAQAQAQNRTLVQPRAGVAGLDEHIALLRTLERAGADFLPTTVDSFTRECRYPEAQRGLEQSVAAGRSLLNGFPMVNHGVEATRKVVESVNLPLFARTAAPDCRLTHEVAIAAGYTSITAGPMVFSLGYAKDYPLEKTIESWQYVYRLVGWYAERGVTLNVEHYLAISTMVPHAISLACAILDSLIAAAQGVRDITLGFGQQCHLAQDAAALRVCARLSKHYLDVLGMPGVALSTLMTQWMGGFPPDEGQAYGVICMGAVAAHMGGATDMVTKSALEAIGIPTPEANASGVSASKMVLRMLADQKLTPNPEIAQEEAILEAEVRAIVDRALELGDGDATAAVVRAIRAGVIDVPFSPQRANANKALPARDWRGAVRWMRPGNVPVPQDIREQHEAALARRLEGSPQRPPWELLLDDVNAISKGVLLETAG